MASNENMHLVSVYEDGEWYDYEHGCFEHARKQFDREDYAILLRYEGGGQYTFLDEKPEE